MMNKYQRVQAEIDLDVIRDNVRSIQKMLKQGTKFMAIIKADGYGHGAISIAHALNNHVDGFGVATIREAENLRNAGIDKMILVLSFTFFEYYDLVVKYDISQTIFSYEAALKLDEEARKQGKKAKIHLKIDTGMGRIGFKDDEESLAVMRQIAGLDHIEIEGIFTHFASSDSKDKSSVNEQLTRFVKFVRLLEKIGVKIPIHHVSNSAAIIDHPEANFDMVRAGIITYGLYPSDEVLKERLQIRPALSLRSHVIFVKEVEEGAGISYGSTFVTPKKMKIATLPIGYADGFPRKLSNKGYVLIHGQKAKVLGRVCMDQTMVDVTEIPDVKVGDKVTIIGKNRDACITVEELSEMTDTINYEFVCNLTKRVPRIYLEGGKVIASMDYTKDEEKAMEYYT